MKISVSRARATLSDVVTAAVRRHLPVLIQRRDEQALLLGLEDVEALLATYEFHPDAYFEETAVTLWLPEFVLYGRGPTYDEAQADLLDEVRAYVADYLAEADRYLNAPNRASHFPHVVRAFVADAHGRLADVLFAAPTDERERTAADERATATV